MAVEVKDGVWKPGSQVQVRDSGQWKPLRYLLKYSGGTWKVIQAFEAPTGIPATPSLTGIVQFGRIDPKVNLGPVVLQDPLIRSWRREVWMTLNGATTLWRSNIDFAVEEFTEEWTKDSGSLYIRVRYYNEAGFGSFSAPSNTITVQSDGSVPTNSPGV